MNTSRTIPGEAYGYSVSIPDTTPNAQHVTIQIDERDGVHIMHAESPDQSELYFEVTAYPGILNHMKLVARQQAFLQEHSTDGELTAAGNQTIAGHTGTIFDFRGTLQGRWKERRFLFLDGSTRTYRIVHDPTSELNAQILRGLCLREGEAG